MIVRLLVWLLVFIAFPRPLRAKNSSYRAWDQP